MATKKHCFCRGEESGLMLCCDTCDLWCHAACFNVTRAQAKSFVEWNCLICSRIQDLKENMIKMINEKVKVGLKEENMKVKGLLEEFEKKCTSHEINKETTLVNLNNLGQENLKLKDIVEGLQRKCNALKSDKEAAQAIANNLRRENLKLKDIVEGLEKKCNALESDKEAARANAKDLRQKHLNLKESLRSQERGSSVQVKNPVKKSRSLSLSKVHKASSQPLPAHGQKRVKYIDEEDEDEEN